MSSSRGDDVTKCVCVWFCLSVCGESFCLVWIIQSTWSKMLQGCLMGVWLKFQGCFREVSGKSQGCLRKVPRLKDIPSSFKGVTKVFKRISTGVSGKFQWCFKFPRSFVLRFCCCMDLIEANLADGGLVLIGQPVRDQYFLDKLGLK